MPSIRTIISDLRHNRAKGVGGQGALGARMPMEGGVLSEFYRVTQSATPITISFGPAPNNIVNMVATPYAAANGFYLFFEDSWSTVATLTRAHRIAAGGGYSGCLYSVYNAGGGNFKCIHTARPNGADSDTFVAAVRQYAQDKGWTLVHEVPTVGGAGVGGCVTTFLMTRISYTVHPTPMVRTVRLRLNALGISVGRDRWQDPA